MKNSKINKFSVIILVTFSMIFFACKSVHNYPNIENYSYLKKESISDYELVSYSNSNDTILVVLKKELARKCGKLTINKIALSNYKKINKIDQNIGFYHNSKTTNGTGITVGSFEPGQSGITKIYSYNGMPYLIENCN